MKVLFVCMGNICRSPAGDNVFRHIVEEEGLSDKIHIDSAGTIGYHTGNAPDARMSATLIQRGYEITGAARQITKEDLAEFDLILAMDHENFDNIHLLHDGEYSDKIKMFTDYCTEHEDRFVPDPYYGGQAGFEHVADLMEDGCRGLLLSIKEKLV